MKKILFIILAFAITAAEAQVSVRRTPKKEKQTTTSTKKPVQTSQKSEKKATTVMVDEPMVSRQAEQPEETVVQQATTVKKSTAAEKKAIATRRTEESRVDNASLRRKLFDETQPQPSADARWQHIVYRELDLNVDANTALYYPQEPVDGLTNFFQVIFEALIKGKIKAYEYLDGREVFSDKYVVKVEDILNTHEIMYRKSATRTGAVQYEVDQADIPSHLVMSYYVKELWEVDKNTSQFRPHVVAICPVLHKIGDFGSNVRYPLFWLQYSDIKPFVNTQILMTAEMNTSHRYTIDDFFTLRLYKGDLYKVQNPRGLTLMQQYPDPEMLEAKRAEIEAQLLGFGKSIYPKEMQDSIK